MRAKEKRAQDRVLRTRALQRNWQRKGAAGKRRTTIKTKKEKKENAGPETKREK